MVANNFFGDFSNILITSKDLDFLSFNASFSLGVKEKKATSEPETKAERTSKITITAIAIIIEIDIVLNVKRSPLRGSILGSSN